MKFKYILVGIVGFGFLIRLSLLLRSQGFDATRFEGKSLPSEVSYFNGIPCHDTQEYKSLALNMLRHRRFSWDSDPVTLRTPGYPLFIAAIYSLFGIKEWIAMLFQIFLSTASIYLIYLIGRSERIGIIAASLFSIDFSSIFYSCIFMSETLFLFFILIGTWLWLKNKSPYSALIFGASVLIRPVTFYLFIPMIFLQRKLKRGVVFLALFFLPLLPWIIRNFSIYQKPLLTSIQGYNLLFSNAAAFESQTSGLELTEVRARLGRELKFSCESNNPLLLSSCAQKIALSKIIQKPCKYAVFHFIGGVNLFLSTRSDCVILKLSGTNINQAELFKVLKSKESLPFKIKIILFAGIEMVIVIGSIILSSIGFVRSPRLPNLLFFLLVLYFFILSGGGLIEGRLRLPMLPYIYLLASSFFFSKKRVDFLSTDVKFK